MRDFGGKTYGQARIVQSQLWRVYAGNLGRGKEERMYHQYVYTGGQQPDKGGYLRVEHELHL